MCALAMTACAGDPVDDPAGASPTEQASEPTALPIVPPTLDDVDPDVDPDVVLPEGFELVAARVTEPDGTVCDLCLWLADDADQRGRGLMSVTDLGPADGMAFRYPSPRTGNFWMKNTLLPLSIAFYAPDGGYLDAFDMEPCTGDPCRRYPTARDFLVAVETTQGGLADIGMTPGSNLELLDLPCE